ncbi:hypothetical protein D3C78_1499930 [compost metagenome]
MCLPQFRAASFSDMLKRLINGLFIIKNRGCFLGYNFSECVIEAMWQVFITVVKIARLGQFVKCS